MATVYGKYQVVRISLGDEVHVTGLVLDDAIGVYGYIVEDHSVFGVGVFSWG